MQANETLRKMRDMRLSGMGDAYSEQLADRLAYDSLPFDERLGMLIDAEVDKRMSTKLGNLVKGAKLRFPDARSECALYDPKRDIEKAELVRYFACTYIDDAIDIVTKPLPSDPCHQTAESTPVIATMACVLESIVRIADIEGLGTWVFKLCNCLI